jgi:uncharacterized damage-inducible protein DinB
MEELAAIAGGERNASFRMVLGYGDDHSPPTTRSLLAAGRSIVHNASRTARMAGVAPPPPRTDDRMDERAGPLAEMLRLNTRLLLNCIDGVSEEEASARAAGGTNSIAFLVAHLIDSRHYLLRTLGGTAENPLSPHLDGARSIDEIESLPSLAAMREAWSAVSAELSEHIGSLDGATLGAAATQRFPIGDRSVLGVLTFLAQHDSYHVGQLSLLRRQLGLPAMKYG